MTAKDHYDRHLGNFYSWMAGDFHEQQQEQEKFFRENKIEPSKNGIAFDLGSGHGLQTISLLNMGFEVYAVDFNKQLLNELANRTANHNIKIIENDVLEFLRQTSLTAELIICMGDTLTHVETLERVNDLIREILKHLEPGGRIVFSFRDLTTELKAEQRFIPVRSDESKILTCFLEYFSGHVVVHDILHEKQDGKWVQKISAYPKLRLDEAVITAVLQQNNIELVKSEIINRMIYIVGQRMD